MSARRAGGCAGLILLAALSSHTVVAQQQDDETDPIQVGLTEQVDVDLVLVDFLVIDNQGRNVPGLNADDFTLKVGGRKTPIASVDVDCSPDGSVASTPDGSDRRPVDTSEDRSPPVAGEPRRIVLVFDYFHIENVPLTIDHALEALERWPTGDEVHTVISLGRSVRVEAPPTTDLGDVRWALQRMRNDPTLYAENRTSLNQYRFFDRMKALFDLVGQGPGRKTVVLFSGPFQPDSFLHDPEYTELSGLSTATRTSIYPVDTGGLPTDLDLDNAFLLDDGSDPRAIPGVPGGLQQSRRLGGPQELRRLANNTGGRITADTNNIGLAYARAHRDLGCTYTLGFYNKEPRLDKKRRLTIKPRHPNMRLVYPEFYLLRSPEEKRKSMAQTATMAPHMYESDQIATDLFVMGPASSSRWRAVMAVEIDLQGGSSDDVVELRGFLRKPNGTIVHDFRKKIPRAAGDSPRVVKFFRDVEVDPGRYIVSAVLSDPGDEKPHAAVRGVQLVRIPAGSPFLIGPILGRQANETAGTDRKRANDAAAFEPLLAPETDRGAPLQMLTLVCTSGAGDAIDVKEIARRVAHSDGLPVEDFKTETVRLPGGGRTHCHELLDSVGTSALRPGLYEISATAVTADRRLESSGAELMVQHGTE